jgi:hypothetical protein
MGFFKDRSDYFKLLAHLNKQVKHDQYVTGTSGPKRSSYYRLNNEEELAAACTNWAHPPFVVHFGYAGRYTENPGEVKKRSILNDLCFLVKAASTDMVAIEAAKDLAFSIMESFMTKMVTDSEDEAYCSPFANIDLGMFSFTEHGPVNSVLYGWRLTFNDETFVEDSDENDWLPEE